MEQQMTLSEFLLWLDREFPEHLWEGRNSAGMRDRAAWIATLSSWLTQEYFRAVKGEK